MLLLETAKPLVVEAGITPASAARGFFMLLLYIMYIIGTYQRTRETTMAA
jgi:hypothetical protein